MRFALTDEQTDLIATVRTLVAKRATSVDLRTAIASEPGYDQHLWRTLVEQIGVTALAVPEDVGGAGFSYIEAHLVLEELGATLTPTPLAGTILATEAILPTAKTTTADRLLTEIADGTRIVALAAATSDRSPLSAEADSRLTGTIATVLDGPGADTILVVADEKLFAVDPTAPGCTISPTPALDPTLRLAAVRLEEAPGTYVGAIDPRRIDAIGATVMTALQSGAAQHALDLTVAYLKERHQFGRPLGSFQALKHRCADLLVQVETARTMSWAAAWELTQPTPDVRLVHAAKAWCSDAFSQVAAEMIQLHGGIGITWEHDAHLYFKRAHATAQLFGRAAHHRRQIMEDQ